MDWEPPFKVCYHCGCARIRRLRPTAFECEECARHLFINPVSAVALILADPDDRVLLVKRAHAPEKGKLSLPGGFMDPGETAEQGACRETREETGLEVDIGEVNYLASFPNYYAYGDTEYIVLDMFFWIRVQDFGKAQALDEVEAVTGVPFDAIDPEQIAFPSVRSALQLFAQRWPELRG
jgi:NAD+ diphosphatase